MTANPHTLPADPAAEIRARITAGLNASAVALRSPTTRLALRDLATASGGAGVAALSAGINELYALLIQAGMADRSTPYGIDEPRPDGDLPPEGQRWLTPREIVIEVLQVDLPEARSTT